MKNLTILKLTFIGLIMILAGSLVNAQEVGMPGGLYQHGSNSGGVNASENTDSVTVGSVLQYWAQPDAASATDNNFTWTVAAALGTQTAGTTTNLATVTFGASTATGTIQVAEGAGACTDATPISINVAVIAAPTATFGADPAAQCTNTPAGLIFTLPITLSTSVVDLPITPNGRVRINYTVLNPDASVLIAAQDADFNETTGSFNVTLTAGATTYGNYSVVINSVTDRISRKPATDISGAIADNTILLPVNRTPVTGPIFHVPNM